MIKSLIDRIKESNRLREIIRFLIVGIIATGIHYGVYLILNNRINVNVSYTIGYIVSLCCNLWLTAHYTFNTKVTVKRTGGFLLSHGINYMIHIGLLNFFLWLGISETIAPIPVYCVAIPVNFILVRTVFKHL